MIKKNFILLSLLCLTFLFISCDTGKQCSHENMLEIKKEPTCTAEGYTEHKCDSCGYSYVSERTAPTGHSFAKETVAPTCTKGGYSEYTCECGESYVSEHTDALGHNYKFSVTEPTCEEHGYTKYVCSQCKNSYKSYFTNATGHSFTETVTAPTCTEQGFTTYLCDCGYSYLNEYTKPTGHTLSPSVTAPTCTEQGYTTFSCECGYKYVSDLTSPTGHTYVEEIISYPSCTEKGETRYTCACSDTYSLIVSPTGHSFTRKVTMPTLSDMGHTEFFCSQCKYQYVGEYRFFSDVLENAYAESTDVLANGIDISHHNYQVDGDGNYISLDWEAIKASGISYVIIRIGDAAIGIDPTFEKSYTEAKAAGLDVGFYFYTRATSVREITLEANLVLAALQGKQFEYPVYLDLEDESLRTIDASILNEMCVTFFTTLQRSGYYTGLYVNDEWLNNVIDTNTALSRFDIWYARYPKTENGETPVWNTEESGNPLGMWQYSDSGNISGIEHTVFDFNYCYKDYPSIVKEYGFNGYDGDFIFIDTEKSFVWVTYNGTIKVRSKPDYFITDGYDSTLDVIGYADYGSRFEVLEVTERYTKINYNGQIAYVSANPIYVSFHGLYLK